jgi:hypothetical protein
LHPIRCIINVVGGDGGRRVHNRRCSIFGVNGDLIARLLFFIGVTEDDYVVVVGRPKKSRLSSPKSL